MEIILSKQCQSLTGSLGKGFGYAIQRRTDLDGRIRFWGVRNSKGSIPPNGHLCFIFACAELTADGLLVANVRVSAKELREAISEAGRFYGDRLVKAPDEQIYNASDVIEFKKRYAL